MVYGVTIKKSASIIYGEAAEGMQSIVCGGLVESIRYMTYGVCWSSGKHAVCDMWHNVYVQVPDSIQYVVCGKRCMLE